MSGLVQVRLGPGGASQANNPAPHKRKTAKVTPWRDVTGVSVRPVGDGAVRLRFEGRKTFWKGNWFPVDAEVRCTSEQAAALEQRIAAWRADSARPTAAVP